MEPLLQFFIIVPILGFAVSLLIPEKKENSISWVAFATVGSHFAAAMIFIAYWFFVGRPTLNLKEIVLYDTVGYEFLVDFYFDKITAIYLVVGSLLTFLVTVYSRYYLHREKGYKRFFNTILLFYIGYNLTIFSGNLETLFIGWEILGISSFLLIAFYRDRYLPVKNAVKIFSIYRIGDVGIILAMWASHHLWHANITFQKLNDYNFVHEHLQTHTVIGVFISVMLLISQPPSRLSFHSLRGFPELWKVRPRQVPYSMDHCLCTWVFLFCLGNFPFWEQQLSVRIMIGVFRPRHRDCRFGHCPCSVFSKKSDRLRFYFADRFDIYRGCRRL